MARPVDHHAEHNRREGGSEEGHSDCRSATARNMSSHEAEGTASSTDAQEVSQEGG